MTGKRELKTSTEHRAVQGSDNRLGAAFEAQQRVVELRRLWWRVEFTNIRPGNKVPPDSMNHNRAYGRIAIGCLNRRK